jgi:3-oxoacyl-[acyl-carrier protein] reductase
VIKMFLEEKVAVVTGGSRGIGKAVCLALASEGACVVVNYYPGMEADAEAVVAEIESAGGRAVAVAGDVSRTDVFDRVVEQTLKLFGRVDILVNNAGITRDGLILRLKEEDWDAVIDTNLKGVFNGIKAVARVMLKQRHGRIINISSVVGITGNAGQTNYAAAKAGIIGLTKSAARELAARGVTVNAVAPGYIVTPMTAGLPESVRKDLTQRIPMQRLGQPEDVANAVLFLASDMASYITGQTLHVDGGMVMV